MTSVDVSGMLEHLEGSKLQAKYRDLSSSRTYSVPSWDGHRTEDASSNTMDPRPLLLA